MKHRVEGGRGNTRLEGGEGNTRLEGEGRRGSRNTFTQSEIDHLLQHSCQSREAKATVSRRSVSGTMALTCVSL